MHDEYDALSHVKRRKKYKIHQAQSPRSDRSNELVEIT